VPISLAVRQQWIVAFVQRLRELGWIEGRTVAIEYRWAEGHTNQLVGLKVFDTLHAHHLDVR